MKTMVYTEQEFPLYKPSEIDSPLPTRQIHRGTPFKSMSEYIAQEILKGIKGHDLVINEDVFLQLMDKVLQTKTAQNELHFCKTCDDSDHFKKLFIAHWVEKLVEALRENKEFEINAQNIGIILQEVDQELTQEDDFQMNDKSFFSWNEGDDDPWYQEQDVLIDAGANDSSHSIHNIIFAGDSNDYLTGDLYTESSIL